VVKISGGEMQFLIENVFGMEDNSAKAECGRDFRMNSESRGCLGGNSWVV